MDSYDIRFWDLDYLRHHMVAGVQNQFSGSCDSRHRLADFSGE
jgi:hypothetical protein